MTYTFIISANPEFPWLFQTTAYASSENIAFAKLGYDAVCPTDMTNVANWNDDPVHNGGASVTCSVRK